MHVTDIERFDIDAAGVVVGGVRHRAIGVSVLPIMRMAGAASVRQSVYRERGVSGGKTVGAISLQLGLVDGRTTPAAAEVVSRFVTRNTPEASSELLASTQTIRVSKSTLDLFGKAFNVAW
ncbi:MAG: hypothetical protein ACJAYU_002769 [Bradymonadia bacterium]